MSDAPFEYSGPPELLAPITSALEAVVDPEVAMNIVDIGLVYGVKVDGDRVDVNVTMTSAACPVVDTIVEDTEFQLVNWLPEHILVHVEVVWDPPWTPERMSERARIFMGW